MSWSTSLCFCSISSRRRLSCLWWTSLWFSICSSRVLYRTHSRNTSVLFSSLTDLIYLQQEHFSSLTQVWRETMWPSGYEGACISRLCLFHGFIACLLSLLILLVLIIRTFLWLMRHGCPQWTPFPWLKFALLILYILISLGPLEKEVVCLYKSGFILLLLVILMFLNHCLPLPLLCILI